MKQNVHDFCLSVRLVAVRWGADQRKDLEHLCPYITRPAIANERLKRNRTRQVVMQLKSPYKDGTTIVMEPNAACQRKPTAPLALSSSERRDLEHFARLRPLHRSSQPKQHWDFH